MLHLITSSHIKVDMNILIPTAKSIHQKYAVIPHTDNIPNHLTLEYSSRTHN